MKISPFYQKQVECINCHEQFKTTKIRSRFVRVVSNESDFKPLYSNESINPLYYNVSVCPQCGFSFTDDFSPYFAPATKQKIEKSITSKWSGRSFSEERNEREAIETYKLAYLSATYKKEKPITIAGIALRIAWLSRDQNDEVEENRFLSLARDLYLQSYTEGDYIGTQMTEIRVLYLVAELSRRIGDKQQAIRSFSRIIEQQRMINEPQIIKMAKDRWEEMRE